MGSGASLERRDIVPNAAQIEIDGVTGVGHHLADVADGLTDTMLVLDQGDADMGIAVLAEADAGRDRDIGLGQQQLRESERAQLGKFLGNGSQANMEAAGAGRSQPVPFNPSIRTSRRS